MEKGYHNFIYDESQIRKFVALLAPLKADEVYLVSMSARNKYLEKAEREELELTRTEMFARKLVKPSPKARGTISDVYIRVLRSLEVARGGYTSRSGANIPDKCLVCYANINPSSGIKAFKKFNNIMMEALFDMRTNSTMENAFAHADSKLMNAYQTERGKLTLLDIDFDIPVEGFDILVEFRKRILQDHETAMLKLPEEKRGPLKHEVIETKSGYHFIIDKSNLKFNYNLAVQLAHDEARARFGVDHVEVILNKNQMVPVPGCLQAGHKVRFMDVSEYS